MSFPLTKEEMDIIEKSLESIYKLPLAPKNECALTIKADGNFLHILLSETEISMYNDNNENSANHSYSTRSYSKAYFIDGRSFDDSIIDENELRVYIDNILNSDDVDTEVGYP